MSQIVERRDLPGASRRWPRIVAGVATVVALVVSGCVIDALRVPGTDGVAAKLAEWGRGHGFNAEVTWLEKELYLRNQPARRWSAARRHPRGGRCGAASPGVGGAAGRRPGPAERRARAPRRGQLADRGDASAASRRCRWRRCAPTASTPRSSSACCGWIPRWCAVSCAPAPPTPAARGGASSLTLAPSASRRRGSIQRRIPADRPQPSRVLQPGAHGVAAGRRRGQPGPARRRHRGRRQLEPRGADGARRGQRPAEPGAAGRRRHAEPDVRDRRNQGVGHHDRSDRVHPPVRIRRHRNGVEVYVAGPALSVCTLGRILQDAGVVRGMELDINPDWVSGAYFHPHPSGAPRRLQAVPRGEGVATALLRTLEPRLVCLVRPLIGRRRGPVVRQSRRAVLPRAACGGKSRSRCGMVE